MSDESFKKYIHYFHKYNAHESSKRFESKLLQTSYEKQSMLKEMGFHETNIQLIRDSTQNLIECRRVLKYTYVSAYFMVNLKEKALLEFNQAELEKATEDLSKELEADHIDVNLIKIRNNAAAKRLINLLDGAYEGFTLYKKARKKYKF